MKHAAAALLSLLIALPAQAAEAPDPLNSPLWPDIRAQVLGDGPVVFDPRVKVTAPASAEDSGNVPISVRAEGIEGVRSMVMFADYNPIPKILAYHPTRAEPFVATRFKVNMATPVRAAVLDGKGVWHVGGVWLDAAGGGCTAPSVASASPEWQSKLGEIHARSWARSWPRKDTTRLRFRLLHPMDTGLAGNIPAFFLETTVIADAEGRELARLETFEPVSENPVVTLELKARPASLKGRDNSGNEFAARLDGGAK